MKKLLKYLVTILLMSTIWSCDIMKESTKNKRETDLEQLNESYRKRKGDTVQFIPLLNIKYRDTTIYITNREGTTLRNVFDSNGQLTESTCMASVIEEMNRNYMKLLEQEKDKTQKKEEKFDSSFILYLVIGIVIIVCFGLFLMYRSINQNQKVMTEILSTLKK